MFLCSNRTCVEHGRDDLIAVGVPEHVLPTFDAACRVRALA